MCVIECTSERGGVESFVDESDREGGCVCVCVCVIECASERGSVEPFVGEH